MDLFDGYQLNFFQHGLNRLVYILRRAVSFVRKDVHFGP